jgi:ADP-heptose:LPS heptosyltransferase
MERVREWIPEEVTSRVRPIKDAELGASLGYLVAGEGHQHEVTEPRDGSSERPKTLGVMISASHPGKELPLRIALEILQSPRLREVELRVLGLPKDRMSQSLQSRLKDLGRLGVDEELKKKSIRETAREILRCDALLSVDTGILHLAEGLGVPVVGLYGPTHRDLGFPVVRSGSEALASSLWCRPCSKDGSMCFRKNRYLCMKETSVEQVVGALVRVLKLSTGAKP